MSIFKRGNVWWYKFWFSGQRIRESAKTSSRTIAKKAEEARRRALERAYNGIPEKKREPLFSTAAKDWLAEKKNLSPNTYRGYQQRLRPVTRAFGSRLVCDISVADVVEYRAARVEDVSNRTVNYEVCCLRGVLKRFGHWAPIAERIQKLRENHDVGRAIAQEDEDRILQACGASQSPSLLPLYVFARDTGLRASELKALRRRDLHLQWKEGVIVAGEVVVPKSKTEAGTGRTVPFSRDLCNTLTLWLSRFRSAAPDSYVFPRHRVMQLRGGKQTVITGVSLSKPVQSWQRAWRTALKTVGLSYRWHDLRHTFITRLAENPAVSEQTIRALAGHVSKQMLERYSHIRTQAKQDAIAALQTGRAQNRAQSGGAEKTQ